MGPRLAQICALTLLLVPALARAQDPRPCPFYGVNPGAPLWGGAVVLDADRARAIAESGAGAVRIDFRLDGAAAWDEALYATYDGIVGDVVDAGLEPLGLVAYEAHAGGQAEWNDDPDGDGMNDYVDGFASTATALFERFGDRVRRWELWNEPSCWSNPDYRDRPTEAGCSYLLPRVFAKLLAETYLRGQATLAAQGGVLVSGGLFAHDIGGSFTDGTDYLAEVYAEGPWDWMEANVGRRYPWDSFGYHLYVQQGGEAVTAETLHAYLDSLRAVMDGAGDAAALSITEIGWQTAGVTPEVQADDLTIAFEALASRADVERAYWFFWQDEPAAGLWYGLRDEHGTPKPAEAALTMVADGCLAGDADGDADADADGDGDGDGDGDADADADADADGDTDADADADGDADGDDAGESGGCGCRVSRSGGRPRPAGVMLLSLALATLVTRDRRRRRRCAPPARRA